VVLPALLGKIKSWIGLDLSNKTTSKTTSMGNQQEVRTPYEPAVGSPS